MLDTDFTVEEQDSLEEPDSVEVTAEDTVTSDEEEVSEAEPRLSSLGLLERQYTQPIIIRPILTVLLTDIRRTKHNQRTEFGKRGDNDGTTRT